MYDNHFNFSRKQIRCILKKYYKVKKRDSFETRRFFKDFIKKVLIFGLRKWNTFFSFKASKKTAFNRHLLHSVFLLFLFNFLRSYFFTSFISLAFISLYCNLRTYQLYQKMAKYVGEYKSKSEIHEDHINWIHPAMHIKPMYFE